MNNRIKIYIIIGLALIGLYLLLNKKSKNKQSLLEQAKEKLQLTYNNKQKDKNKVIFRFNSPDAHQGVAVSNDYIYAINNNAISKHHRNSKFIERKEYPKLKHLNGGAVISGILYCPHNPPEGPNKVYIFDVDTLEEQGSFKVDIPGSLTWVDFYNGELWGVSAEYKDNVYETKLHQFNARWKRP